MAFPANTKILTTSDQVTVGVCTAIEEVAKLAIEDRGIFTIAVSGGSVAKFLCAGLPKIATDWTKWKVFFCDERLVPLDDDESTYKAYREGIFSKDTIAESNIFPAATSLSASDAAADYKKKLESVFPGSQYPEFDMLVLGMGPDGHTCSLFPGHPAVNSKDWVTSITDSPKPPPQRITFTLPVLNVAKNAFFISCGAGKADILKAVLKDNPDDYPAGMVNPTNGNLKWWIDQAAAAKL